MSENLKAYEAEIRADERAKVGKTLTAIAKRAFKLSEDATRLNADIDKLLDVPQQANGADHAPKAKRKPIAADDRTVEKVAEVLRAYPNTPMKPSEIREELPAPFDQRSPKAIGAALRQLVERKTAIEKPRGKYQHVTLPATLASEMDATA